MEIFQMTEKDRKKKTVRKILEALPEWFGLSDSREEYIKESAEQVCFVAVERGKTIGFLCLKETGKATLEIAVLGVLKEFHRQGIGTQLFTEAKKYAVQQGYSFMQVKTVQMGRYASYDDTNRFYQSLGFQEFEVFSTLWDEKNPCQIYVMSIEKEEHR